MFFVSSLAAACGIPEYQWVLFIAYQWADYRSLSTQLPDPASGYTKPIRSRCLGTGNSFSGKRAGWPHSHCLRVTESVSRWRGKVVPRRRATGCPLHDALRGPLLRPPLETGYVIVRHWESVHLARFSSKLWFNGDVITYSSLWAAQLLSEWQVYEWHCESGYDLFDSPSLCLTPHNETLPVSDPVWDIDNLTFSLFLPEELFSLVYLLFKFAS